MRPANRNGSTILLMVCAAIGIALLPPQDSPQGAASKQPPDTSFAIKAASVGVAEMQLGRLAQKKGSNDAIRDFGKRVETDQIFADDQLRLTAERNNLALPATPSKNDQLTYDRLSKLSGTDFDLAFVQQIVESHQNEIAAFTNEISSGKNAQIRDFATETLPTLQDQLGQVEAMQEQLASNRVDQKNGF